MGKYEILEEYHQISNAVSSCVRVSFFPSPLKSALKLLWWITPGAAWQHFHLFAVKNTLLGAPWLSRLTFSWLLITLRFSILLLLQLQFVPYVFRYVQDTFNQLVQPSTNRWMLFATMKVWKIRAQDGGIVAKVNIWLSNKKNKKKF